jgi:predicted nucleotidyltransferase
MSGKQTNTYVNKYVLNWGKNKLTRKLFSCVLFGLLSHWTFQNMLVMDRTERIFKISLDILMTIFLSLILSFILPPLFAVLPAILLAHTFNFFFNSQVWVVLKYYGYVNLTRSAFDEYTDQVISRIRDEPSIASAVIFGSLARNEWRPSTDLDMRLIRKCGLVNGFRSCIFVMGERSRSLFAKFPIDICVLDTLKPLDRLRKDEELIIIK